MGKKIAWIAGICFLAGAAFFGMSVLAGRSQEEAVVFAAKERAGSDIEQEIEENSQRRQSLEQERQRLLGELDELEKKQAGILEYIEALDQKLDDLTVKLAQNRNQIDQAKSGVAKLRKEKAAAEESCKKQYDTMKKRIKYMYENGQEGYLELLLESESLSELFNRAEYVGKVSDYDNTLLQRYQKACEELEQKKRELEEELERLKELRESLKSRKESVELLAEKKSAQLAQYQEMIEGTGSIISSTENALRQQEEELEGLLEAQRRQEEKKANSRKSDQGDGNHSQDTGSDKTAKDNNNAGEGQSQRDSGAERSGSSASALGYRWPLPVAGRITSHFGYRKAPTAGASTYHKGIDIAVPLGTSVLAAKAGTVVTASYSASAGNYVAVYHGGGVYSYYMHCSKLSVRSGTKVKAGQQIALSGNTGVSTGPHLHFAIFAGGSYVNPLNYVSN